jgi:hypothetical protein
MLRGKKDNTNAHTTAKANDKNSAAPGARNPRGSTEPDSPIIRRW